MRLKPRFTPVTGFGSQAGVSLVGIVRALFRYFSLECCSRLTPVAGNCRVKAAILWKLLCIAAGGVFGSSCLFAVDETWFVTSNLSRDVNVRNTCSDWMLFWHDCTNWNSNYPPWLNYLFAQRLGLSIVLYACTLCLISIQRMWKLPWFVGAWLVFHGFATRRVFVPSISGTDAGSYPVQFM